MRTKSRNMKGRIINLVLPFLFCRCNVYIEHVAGVTLSVVITTISKLEKTRPDGKLKSAKDS